MTRLRPKPASVSSSVTQAWPSSGPQFLTIDVPNVARRRQQERWNLGEIDADLPHQQRTDKREYDGRAVSNLIQRGKGQVESAFMGACAP